MKRSSGLIVSSGEPVLARKMQSEASISSITSFFTNKGELQRRNIMGGVSLWHLQSLYLGVFWWGLFFGGDVFIGGDDSVFWCWRFQQKTKTECDQWPPTSVHVWLQQVFARKHFSTGTTIKTSEGPSVFFVLFFFDWPARDHQVFFALTEKHIGGSLS